LLVYYYKKVYVKDSTLFPNKQYLISKIEEVLKYSSDKTCFVQEVTKIKSHDGKEITTVEELVDKYYKAPEDYFELDDNNNDNNNFNLIKKRDISEEYLQKSQIASKLQGNSAPDVKPIELDGDTSTKLFQTEQRNNFLYSCYYCNSFQTNSKEDYEHHVVTKHPNKLAYPSEADLERLRNTRKKINEKEDFTTNTTSP
jgi:hypothetical protein